MTPPGTRPSMRLVLCSLAVPLAGAAALGERQQPPGPAEVPRIRGPVAILPLASQAPFYPWTDSLGREMISGDEYYAESSRRRQAYVEQIRTEELLCLAGRRTLRALLRGQGVEVVPFGEVDQAVSLHAPRWWDEDQRTPERLRAIADQVGAQEIVYLEVISHFSIAGQGSLNSGLAQLFGGLGDGTYVWGTAELYGPDGRLLDCTWTHAKVKRIRAEVDPTAGMSPVQSALFYQNLAKTSPIEALQTMSLYGALADNEAPEVAESALPQAWDVITGKWCARWLGLLEGSVPSYAVGSDTSGSLAGGWVWSLPGTSLRWMKPASEVPGGAYIHVKPTYPWVMPVVQRTGTDAIARPRRVGLVVGGFKGAHDLVKQAKSLGIQVVLLTDPPGQARWITKATAPRAYPDPKTRTSGHLAELGREARVDVVVSGCPCRTRIVPVARPQASLLVYAYYYGSERWAEDVLRLLTISPEPQQSSAAGAGSEGAP